MCIPLQRTVTRRQVRRVVAGVRGFEEEEEKHLLMLLFPLTWRQVNGSIGLCGHEEEEEGHLFILLRISAYSAGA